MSQFLKINPSLYIHPVGPLSLENSDYYSLRASSLFALEYDKGLARVVLLLGTEHPQTGAPSGWLLPLALEKVALGRAHTL